MHIVDFGEKARSRRRSASGQSFSSAPQLAQEPLEINLMDANRFPETLERSPIVISPPIKIHSQLAGMVKGDTPDAYREVEGTFITCVGGF